MKFYITNLSIYVLIFLYLPVVIWVLYRIGRSQLLKGVGKAILILLSVLLAYAIPLGDVTLNSLAMAKVCPTAGLHIYKTAEVEGFVGSYNLKDTPYRFIEYPKRRIDDTPYWIRYERGADGAITSREVESPSADYEVVSGEWHVDRSSGIEMSVDQIINRHTGEVLADRRIFNPLPGWLDRILVVRWFGVGGRQGCWGSPSAGINEAKVLLPKQPNN